MTLEIDFLPFATGTGAGVESQTAWVTDVVVINGFVTGTAQSTQVNKAIRQPSFVAAAIAHYMANAINQNILDNGNLDTFWSQFWQSLLLGGAFTDQGSTNSIVIDAPSGLSFPSPTNGLQIAVKVAATNTGPMTINWMGNGAVNVTYPNGAALVGGETVVGGYSTFIFDGTKWQLVEVSPNSNLPTGYANRAETLNANYTVVAGDGGKNFSITTSSLTITIGSSYITSGNGPVVLGAYSNQSFTLVAGSGVFVGGNSNVISGKNSVVVSAGGWIALEPDGTNLRIVAGDPSSVGVPGNLNIAGNSVVQGSLTVSGATSLQSATVTSLTSSGLTSLQSLTAASGLFSNITNYSSAGSYTFTVPSNVYEIYAEVFGSGGGSGGGATNGAGGGGGGGGRSYGYFSVTPGQVLTVTVGAGGSAGTTSSNGGNGNSSSVAGLLSASGGNGGTFGSTGNYGIGGTGGSGSGGQVNYSGYSGANAQNFGTYVGGSGGMVPGGGQHGNFSQGISNGGGFPAAGASGGANNNNGSSGGSGQVIIKY